MGIGIKISSGNLVNQRLVLSLIILGEKSGAGTT
jgi:hypothetical protein